ncbi:hypothetical protein BJY01DRAFT_230001 [Aspergillus pseudoustus]|uniref:Uncharacterized protein n=1 Tax=Aspergillus pseudoustus TaxID=1810923 RepID=A0ABR4IE35_9EURO
MTALNPVVPGEDKPKQTDSPLAPLSTSLPSVAEAEIEPVPVSLVDEKATDPIITSSELEPQQITQHTQHLTVSTHHTQSTTQADYDPHIGAKPYSPFYRHATPSSKLSRLTSQRKRSRSVGMVTSPIDDVEGGVPAWQRLYDDETRNTRESKLWTQERRYCDCLSGMSKRQRMALKIAIAVVILGSMVAIALGITAAVGGGVWSGVHQQEKLP